MLVYIYRDITELEYIQREEKEKVIAVPGQADGCTGLQTDSTTTQYSQTAKYSYNIPRIRLMMYINSP